MTALALHQNMKLQPGTRVHERGWPDTIWTVERESPAGDDWYFVRLGSQTLSMPRHQLVVVDTAPAGGEQSEAMADTFIVHVSTESVADAGALMREALARGHDRVHVSAVTDGIERKVERDELEQILRHAIDDAASA